LQKTIIIINGTSELGDLFAESHRLEDEIKKQLGVLDLRLNKRVQ
jgi:hypothetical protein